MNNPARYLWLIRHAKARKDYTRRDYERRLSERGINDAKLIRDVLDQHDHPPQFFLASSATRTTHTADLLAHSRSVPKVTIDSLYLAGFDNVLSAIRRIPSEYQSAAIVGHNPTISRSVTLLTKDSHTSYLPTLGSICIQFVNANWNDISELTGILETILLPRDFKT